MEGRVALFDMDGTLFDHNGSLKESLLKVTPEEWHDYIGNCDDLHKFEDTGEWAKNLADLIRTSPGWWRNLPRWEPGWQIYEVVKTIGFCCKVLTKGPRSKPIAWMEKVQCIHDHFGDEMPIDIVGKHKGGTYGRVLVDDFPDYLEKWLKHRPRGLAIMPAHSYNSHFTHENVIRYTDNLEEVTAALQAAYDREEKQHWKELL